MGLPVHQCPECGYDQLWIVDEPLSRQNRYGLTYYLYGLTYCCHVCNKVFNAMREDLMGEPTDEELRAVVRRMYVNAQPFGHYPPYQIKEARMAWDAVLECLNNKWEN